LISLAISNITEPQTRDNFKSLEKELKTNPITNGEWKLIDKNYLTSGTYKIIHNLGFKPIDVIQTYFGPVISFDLDAATKDQIEITISTAGRIRFLIGRMN
jgi:hypothetical protein